MFNPIATYRFQFHKGFPFAEFEKLIEYLQALGVSTVYASPLFRAAAGSTHGYDGLNPHEINPEIGSLEQLKNIRSQLRAANVGWLQDIVPNHMAYDPANQWLMDLLEKGPQSKYAKYFDTAWSGEFYRGKIMVPFLGKDLAEVIKEKELAVACKEDSGLVFKYYDAAYPLQPRSYQTILEGGAEAPKAIQQLVDQIPKNEEVKQYAEGWDEVKQQFLSLIKNKAVNAYVTKRLEEINGKPESLAAIHEQQSYRLCCWQETDRMINYRRFFTVNGLICMNIQNDEVFDDYHKLIKDLTEEGVFDGLRVDHVDGLFDPSSYLARLRKMAGDDTFIIVEKILEPGEAIPESWPIQGNTGYDFLSLANNLLTSAAARPVFDNLYDSLVENYQSLQQQVNEKKSYILHQHMTGELENLYQLFISSDLVEKRAFAAIRKEEVREAIAEFLINCPVYRYYGNSFPLQAPEEQAVRDIFNNIRKQDPDLSRAADLLEDALVNKPKLGDLERNKRTQHFYQRCMQFTGPLMAKGVEDTLMYTYDRFVGHNEVGDSPQAFGITPDAFHQAMIKRQQQWPLSLNATATHDTKRGEDVRARLNVLTDMAEQWSNLVNQWRLLNEPLRDEHSPDANDEYFIYQALVGAYPLQPEEQEGFAARIQEYLQKALREAKTHSNWTSPDSKYEEAAKSFAVRLLDKAGAFWPSFDSLFKKVSDYGIVNSLVQVLLKFTCPGVPDVYQGCELWDFSFVDPDNRRPVDYATRRSWLEQLQKSSGDVHLTQLWNDRASGKVKLWLTSRLYQLRREQPALFLEGEYLPLKLEGVFKDHAFAFMRVHRRSVLMVVVPLHVALLAEQQKQPVTAIDWKDTRVILPDAASENWQNLLTGEKEVTGKIILLSHLFKTLPFSAQLGQKVMGKRSAGLLLHISSLPSAFGIGDLGPQARMFAGFLHHHRQRYWQVLPINPTEAGQGHSPYSSISSRAGNTLFISPELLVREGLLQPGDLNVARLPVTGKVDFASAEQVRKDLLSKAWTSFKQGKAPDLQPAFEQFKEKESSWLHDFARYILLKQQHAGKPWYEWPDALKQHNEEAVNECVSEHADAVEQVKWEQFIFAQQWHSFKQYCNKLEIELIGDLPFYVSYDSSDVWSNKNLFALDQHGNSLAVAGVPPDDFSADGQLWGMPVYRWDVLKEKGYSWWLDRLRRNQELFDIVRLDHFRAFSAYWEVPAGEKTARNGVWKEGPGAEFFNVVQEQLGELPFIAEDLGDIDDPVYQLRDEFNLPGMKVLQFAFSDNMPVNPYVPHNYTENFIVYTGTHDNNTTRGWLRQEGAANKSRIEQYTAREVTEVNVGEVLARLAYSSVARIAILPVQDLIGLDESARMNIPSSGENNWSWRLLPGQLTEDDGNKLNEWAYLYNRG